MGKGLSENTTVIFNGFHGRISRLVLIVLFALPLSSLAQVNFATTANLDEHIKRMSVNAGAHMIHSEPGKFKVYVVFRDGHTMEIYAIDSRGKRLEPTFAKAKNNCEVCFRIGNGKLYCYDINCASIPKKASTPPERPSMRKPAKQGRS